MSAPASPSARESLAAPARPGDRAPPFYGMLANGQFHASDDQAGRVTVLILAGRMSPSELQPMVSAFAGHADAFARLGGEVMILVSANPRWMEVALPEPGPAILHCPSEEVFARVGLNLAGTGGMGAGGGDARRGAPVVLVLDRSLRIVARLEHADPAAIAAGALARIAALPRETTAVVASPAPVLVVPNLIDPDFCRTLIAAFEHGGHAEGEIASADSAGQPVSRVDPAKKLRRDGALDPQTALHGEVLAVLERRLLPEMKRAFQTDVAHIDRVLIARYDDAGGYFRRHRDNTAPLVAFRQFAVSLNLNTEAYEGGELCFPEFNDHLYSPPTGGACVFSASLLHEARPVTRGRRYVLLTFLHDDAAEARRLAQLAASFSVPAAA